MDLETVLGALEAAQRAAAPQPPRGTPLERDPERYFFSIFGTPSTKDTWGWRVEGHHVSLHFTVVNGTLVAGVAVVLRQQPRRSPRGAEEGTADSRRGGGCGARAAASRSTRRSATKAIIDATAPDDMVTMANVKIDPLSPSGHRRGRDERDAARSADEAARRLHRLDGRRHRRGSRWRGCARPASRRSASPGRARPSAARSTTTGFRARRSSSSTTTPRTTATTSIRCGAISMGTSGGICCAST